MKAVVFAGPGAVRIDEVAVPSATEQGDAVVEVAKASICGSDIHLLHGKTPGMREGGVIGHEYVGTVVESRSDDVAEGDRVIGSFLIACGECPYCKRAEFNFCRSRRALGLGTLTGDLDGAQAERVRVPGATHNLLGCSGPLESIDDESLLFAGDILTTGFYAAALAEVKPGDTVAVIGAGPVGLCCALAAQARGPGKLLVLDADPQRVEFARDRMGLEALDVSDFDPQAAVAGATNGEMADAVIEAVGAIPAFKSAMKCVRDGGRLAVVGVYGSERVELSMGMAWIRGIDIRFAGMANVQRHWREAVDALAAGTIDPTTLITHRLPLEEAAKGYELFESREAMKVVLTP